MFDYSWIEAPCPDCGFINNVMFRQIRLEERTTCTGCHKIVQLTDEHVSVERSQREINRAIEKLKSQLKDITITIKI
jgi:phage FluMu protein Com